MLVIADQKTLRIGRERGLAGARKAEEHRRVLAVHIGICRAVHRCNAAERQVIVHHREHTLLHLAAVPGIQNNLLLGRDVEDNRGLGVEAEFLVVLNFCLRRIVDNEVRLKVLELFRRRTNEHIGHKMCLPCDFDDEAHCHAGIRVRTAECVNHKEALAGELLFCKLFDCVPSLFGSRMVIILVFIGGPPDRILGVLVHDDKLVFRRATRVNAGHHVDCAELGHLPLFEAFQTRLGLLFK